MSNLKSLEKLFLPCLLTACLFVFLGLNPVGIALAAESPFLVKPYVQLGNHRKITRNNTDRFEILWCAGKKDGWKLQFRPEKKNKEESWQESAKISASLQKAPSIAPYHLLCGTIENPSPGSVIEYRLQHQGKVVFQSKTRTRKSKEQPFTFAVAGDIGAGSPGQKSNVYQIHKNKPDLFLIPGDITYNRGRVSEYLTRFFPILNCDQASPKTGAPLLRSTLTLTAIGNHDIALTSRWDGVDFSHYPDALGYYRFWSQPMNGPASLANGRNTTKIKGDSRAQLDFVRSAGKRFPRMANYSFEYGNAHFLVLDANPYMDWTDKKWRSWLEKDLISAQKAAWRFVLCHQPGFSVDNNHWVEQRMRLLCDLFEKHKVDIVLSGHAHTYQRSFPLKFSVRSKDGIPLRNANGTVNGAFILDKNFDGKTVTKPDGVLYIVSGAGGASLYRKGILNHEESLFNSKFIANQHSFSLCKVEGKNLLFKQIGCDGKELDTFRVTKD